MPKRHVTEELIVLATSSERIPMTTDALDVATEPRPDNRRRIGIACNEETCRLYLHPDDLRRLERLGQVVLRRTTSPAEMARSSRSPRPRAIFFAAGLEASA
jgi:hypothetical protein